MILSDSDTIITAYAETAKGPGWANAPVWVVVYNNRSFSYRLECIQPEEFTDSMWALYDVSEAAHRGMVCAIKSALNNKVNK